LAERLKLEPCSELHSAEVIGCGGNRSKRTIPRTKVRESKPLMVERVKHLGANLEGFAFTDLEFLGQGSVQVANSVASQIREMSRRIAGNVIAGIREAILV
jgi:hypothetical protein